MKRIDTLLRGRLYRSRKGIFLGVCRGLAEYFDFSVFWTRAVTVALLFLSGFWPIMILYFIAALLIKPEPVIPLHSDDEREFYDSYVQSRKGAVDRVKRRYQNLERRIQRLEHRVTAKDFDWESRLNNHL